MFRRIAFAAVTATGLVSGLALTPANADAHSPDTVYVHGHHRYEVLIRHHGHWDVYGSFRDRDDAERAARRLEHRGYDARIRRVAC